MKVLHIALSDSGGAGRGMINQHLALLEQGVDSKVLVAIKHTDLDSVFTAFPNHNVLGSSKSILLFERILRKLGVCLTEYDKIHRRIYRTVSRYPVQFSSPITQYDLSEHPLVQQADILNLHYISDFVDYTTFFRAVHKPIVWTIRDENPGLGGFHYRTIKEEYYRYYAKLEEKFLAIKRESLLQSDNLHIVPLSRQIGQFCDSVDFLSRHPKRIIYNTIHPDDYVLFNKQMAKASFGFKSDDVVISFVCCSLGEKRKHFDLACKAIDLLDDQKIRLLCVGREDITVKKKHIYTLGTIDDTRRLSLVYSASDVFLSPSEQESFGKTVVEALYCGVPVVCSSVGIAPEIIHDRNGILCDIGNANEVASSIRQVLGRKYDRSAIRIEATHMFSPVNIANQYIDLYISLLSS